MRSPVFTGLFYLEYFFNMQLDRFQIGDKPAVQSHGYYHGSNLMKAQSQAGCEAA